MFFFHWSLQRVCKSCPRAKLGDTWKIEIYISWQGLIETKPLPSNISSTTLFCSDGCCPQLDWFTISLIKVDAEQENGGGEEIVNLLKHVRPGNGFEFKGDMFDKVDLIRQFCFLPFCIFLVLKLMFAEPNTFSFFLEKSSLFGQVEVNGENEHPLFTFLKKSLPAPSDDSESLMAR